MKKVTISVPDGVYRPARIRAAERGTSVSAMVTEYLVSLANNARAIGLRSHSQEDHLA
jgi:plasmid stability protein